MEVKCILNCESVPDFVELFRDRQQKIEEEGLNWYSSVAYMLTTTWTEDILLAARVDNAEKVRRLQCLMAASNEVRKLPA